MTSDWSLQRAEFVIDLQNMMMIRSGMMLLKTFDRDRPQLCPHKDCIGMAKKWTLAMCVVRDIVFIKLPIWGTENQIYQHDKTLTSIVIKAIYNSYRCKNNPQNDPILYFSMG